MVKITVDKKIEKIRHTRDFELGNPGDLLLILSNTKIPAYNFGRFKEVEHLPDNAQAKDRIIFEGGLYGLNNLEVLGVNSPNFRRKPTDSFATTSIEQVWTGKENIINYLQNEAGSKYQGHAGLINKIQE